MIIVGHATIEPDRRGDNDGQKVGNKIGRNRGGTQTGNLSFDSIDPTGTQRLQESHQKERKVDVKVNRVQKEETGVGGCERVSARKEIVGVSVLFFSSICYLDRTDKLMKRTIHNTQQIRDYTIDSGDHPLGVLSVGFG